MLFYSPSQNGEQVGILESELTTTKNPPEVHHLQNGETLSETSSIFQGREEKHKEMNKSYTMFAKVR